MEHRLQNFLGWLHRITNSLGLENFSFKLILLHFYQVKFQNRGPLAQKYWFDSRMNPWHPAAVRSCDRWLVRTIEYRTLPIILGTAWSFNLNSCFNFQVLNTHLLCPLKHKIALGLLTYGANFSVKRQGPLRGHLQSSASRTTRVPTAPMMPSM
jgi:hypothetical protein